MFQITTNGIHGYNVVLGAVTIARQIRTLKEAEEYVRWEARRRSMRPVYMNNDNCKVTLH